MPGEIIHIELPSRDFERSAAFYAKLFGWRTDGAQSGGHLLFQAPGSTQGSWIRDALAEAPGPIPFVAVDDVDKALGEVEKQGGRVLVRRLTLAGRGTFGLFADLDGNVVAVLASRPAGATGGAAGAVPAAADGKAAPAAGVTAPKKPAVSAGPATGAKKAGAAAPPPSKPAAARKPAPPARKR